MPGVVNPAPTVDEAAAALARIRQKCGARAAGLDSLSKLLAWVLNIFLLLKDRIFPQNVLFFELYFYLKILYPHLKPNF